MKYIFIFLFFSGLAHAEFELSYSSPEILARADLRNSFNLPDLAFLSNSSPVINDNGDVALKVMYFDETSKQGIWVKTKEDKNGKILFTAPNERFITDPSLNDFGKIVFNQFDEGVTDGIFTYDAYNLKLEQLLVPDTSGEILNYTYPTIKNNGEVYFRGTSDRSIRTIYQYKNNLNILLREGENKDNLMSSYIFRPSINQNGDIALKVRLGNVGEWGDDLADKIVVISKNDSKREVKIIAEDKDSNAESHYSSFGNSLSINNKSHIAFYALSENNVKMLILYKNGKLIPLASEGRDEIKEIETFAPVINDHDNVLFRAKNKDGIRSIYLVNENKMIKIISEGDNIPTDLGYASVLSNPNFPGFGGEVDLNNLNEIVFIAILSDIDKNKDLGTGLFKVTPKK